MLKYARICGKLQVVTVVRESVINHGYVVVRDYDGVEHLVHWLDVRDVRPGEV